MKTEDINSSFILNWSPLRRCMLMLCMGFLLHGDWLIWKLFIYFKPELWQFVNIELLIKQLMLNLLILPILMLLFILCMVTKGSTKYEQILVYICVIAFSLSMTPDAYLSGVMCPATSLTFMIAFIVGLFLLKRVVIYSAAIIIIGIFSIVMYLTLQSKIPYAPLFAPLTPVDSTKASIFWTLSMLWFMSPVFLVGVVLLEMLMSQWRQREKNVQILSQVDPLTDLYNRRTIYSFLNILITKKYTDERMHSLILLDLDYFKQVNDKYGHVIGDRVLVETANILKNNIRGDDLVGRFGGEEFIIVLANTTFEQTQQVAERCRNELSQLKIYSDKKQEVTLTASFGVADFNCHVTSLDTVLKQADEALYHAKHMGRNNVVHYKNYLEQMGACPPVTH